MNRPQYAIMEGNLGNVFAVDSLTGRIYAVGELVYSYRNVRTVLSLCGHKGSFTRQANAKFFYNLCHCSLSTTNWIAFAFNQCEWTLNHRWS